MNALAVTGKTIPESVLTVAGSGPGAKSFRRFDEQAGAKEVRAAVTDEATHDLLKSADVYVGVSSPAVLTRYDVAAMHEHPVIFAMGMPDPELESADADGVAVYATACPDMPNQINSTLAFPGIWRGLLDVRATEVADHAIMAAASAIANIVTEEGALGPDYVVPSVFNKRLVPAVAAVVSEASRSVSCCVRLTLTSS